MSFSSFSTFDLSTFDWISIIYSALSIDTLRRLVKYWESFWDDQVTELDRFLVQRVALFILIPIGVLFHEVGHAIATWQVGGTVAEFQWRVFWGYVVPYGAFSSVQYWWIALSGNVVSIALGLIALPAMAIAQKQVMKELLYSFAVVELVYSLLFYPIFSFTGFEGDWVKIYDFSVYPYAQITLGVHLILIVGLWYITKSKRLDPAQQSSQELSTATHSPDFYHSKESNAPSSPPPVSQDEP
ncbi:MAG: hypothetical protein VKL39_01100 [Leptolyngbyaceae bacterium]|nr:hypothetical protein [Leptolyngbyaceae bacterium]